jgi:hypothetical protein
MENSPGKDSVRERSALLTNIRFSVGSPILAAMASPPFSKLKGAR